MAAGPPAESLIVPASVQAITRGRPTRLVWQNEIGGLTFEVGGDDQRCFVTRLPPEPALGIEAEAARIRWADAFLVVPHVIDVHRDASGACLDCRPRPDVAQKLAGWTTNTVRLGRITSRARARLRRWR